MVNQIYKNGSGHKVARPIGSAEEYIALRNAPDNVKNFYDARAGDDSAKPRQVEFNYNDILPDGVLKGCCHPSSTYSHDIDCGDAKEQERIKDVLLEKKEEIGLLELSGSARYGLHAVCRREPGKTIRECQYRLSMITKTEYDTNARGLARVMFTGPATPDNLFYLDNALFEETMTVEDSEREYCLLKEREENGLEEVPPEAKKSNKHYRPFESAGNVEPAPTASTDKAQKGSEAQGKGSGTQGKADPKDTGDYNGLPYRDIIAKWWEMYNEGKEPVKNNRDVLTFELAVNLRHICGFDRELMDKVIPCYDNFPQAQKMKCIDSALAEKRTQMPKRLKDVLFEVRRDRMNGDGGTAEDADGKSLDEAMQEDEGFYYNRLPKMPQGVKDSIDAVGPQLSMPVIVAVCPVVGMLATGVRLDIHGSTNSLNLISYIAGEFASGKGSIDPVISAWMGEVAAVDKMYQAQEDEWAAKKRAAKNKKEQPEEPKLPVRFIALNSTVAKLAERLANTDGKHAFSYTPEADTVAQKWKSVMSDFSVMLRQSYDGSRYDREAKSVDAVNVHIEHLLWNVTMCGTPDALYRVITNYTDGLQSRIAIARTPDNTYAPLADSPYVLTAQQAERIRQIAHLLPLMQGDVTLPKLEACGRKWLEQIRLETIKSDDRVKARQRFRTCVTAQRMTCCLMLCRVAEQLIQKHGLNGAEKMLKQKPDIWKEMLQKVQTPSMLGAYDVMADYLMDCGLYFFRERIENAISSRDYAANADRRRTGKNDSIFERLDSEFGFEAAMQHSISVKGAGVSHNQVRQMLKNWIKQGLIIKTENGRFRKVSELNH